MTAATRVTVEEPSQVAEARRVATALAAQAGFDEVEEGKVAIAATEAATNLLKHAGGGEVIVARRDDAGATGLELYALDKGAGISDLTTCLQDGYSTAGSSGTGLGAMRRQSGELDIYTLPQRGTVLVARFWRKGAARPAGPLDVGAICLPVRGETACGDAWAVRECAWGSLLLVVDGLGHGPLAATAADDACAVLRRTPAEEPLALLEEIHLALRGTRGAAGAVVALHPAEGLLTFAGVGNVAAVVVGEDKERHAVSTGGILGHEVRTWRQFSYPWSEYSVLVVHTDGIGTRWNLASYPGLAARAAALTAGVLYRDFVRTRDDATVVVVKQRRTG